MTQERVLVVDDEDVVRLLLEKSLEAEGYDVLSAADGDEAFRIAMRERPHLVLLDLMMPRFDGYEFLRRRREEPSLQDVPVVVLTAYGGERQVVRAIEEGADDFLVKPLSLVELSARLHARLRDRRAVADLQGKRRDQEALLQLSTALASQLDVRQILFTVASRLAELVQVDRVSFVIVSRDLQHGYILAASEDPEAHNIRVALANYPEILEVVKSLQPLVISDVSSHPLLADVAEAITRTDTRSLMLFPLVVAEEPIGVLFLRARARQGLSPREERICGIVANASAVALRNAQVLDTVRGDSLRIRRARAEAERRVNHLQRYEAFCESISDGMATLDEEGRFLFVNGAAERILGRPRSEVVGRTLASLAADADRSLTERLVRDVSDHEPSTPVDVRIVAPDAEERILSVSVAAVLGEHGAAVLSFRDATADHRREGDLRHTQELLDALVSQSADAIIAADGTGRITRWNTAAEKLFGVSEAEALSERRLAEFFPREEIERITRLLRAEELGGTGRLSAIRVEVSRLDGTRLPARLSASFLEQATAFVATLSDLRAQEELARRVAAVEENLAKSEERVMMAALAGTAAHELNQPLTSLLGLAEVIRRGLHADHPLQGTVDSVMRETERIADTVRKLGTLSRFETKEYVGAAKIVDLDRSRDEDG